MLPYMRDECPAGTSEATLKKIYGSIKVLRTKYEWDDPIRQGAIRAYTRTNGVIFIVATLLAVIPVVFSLMMPGINSHKIDIGFFPLTSHGRLLSWKTTERSNQHWP